MNWLYIFVLIGLAFGIVAGMNRLKSMRSQPYSQAEITWKQNPLWAWRYEPLAMIVITIHSLGVLCLAAIFWLSLLRSELLTFLPRPGITLMLSALAVLGVFFTTYISGTVVVYHFARRWAGPRSYGISKDGIFYGNSLMSWKTCSHYEIGPDDGQVSLYSSYSPSLRTWVFQPPTESYSRVLALIQENLPPASPMGDSFGWWRSPLMLILEMTALVLIPTLPAILGLLLNNSWVWVYALVQFFVVGILGNRLITVFDGRGKYPEQKVATTQATSNSK